MSFRTSQADTIQDEHEVEFNRNVEREEEIAELEQEYEEVELDHDELFKTNIDRQELYDDSLEKSIDGALTQQTAILELQTRFDTLSAENEALTLQLQQQSQDAAAQDERQQEEILDLREQLEDKEVSR